VDAEFGRRLLGVSRSSPRVAEVLLSVALVGAGVTGSMVASSRRQPLASSARGFVTRTRSTRANGWPSCRFRLDTKFVLHEDRGSRIRWNQMKNVTVTMEESVADWARMEAARRNTSVSRLIGEMLAEKMRHDDAYERAMREALKFEPLPFTAPYARRDDIYAERIDRFR
jgi:hypothetical protein